MHGQIKSAALRNAHSIQLLILIEFIVKSSNDKQRDEDFDLSLTVGSGTAATHCYMLCGWHTRCDIPLAGVPRLECDREDADVVIQFGPGNSPLANVSRWIEHSFLRSYIRIDNVADFEITEGREIRVWPATGQRKRTSKSFYLDPLGRLCVTSAEYCHSTQVQLQPKPASSPLPGTPERASRPSQRC